MIPIASSRDIEISQRPKEDSPNIENKDSLAKIDSFNINSLLLSYSILLITLINLSHLFINYNQMGNK